MSAPRARAGACVLLLAFFMQGYFSLIQKSVTVDEMVYITAGYYHLTTGKFDFNRTNPPLAKLISASPLLILDLELPEITSDRQEWNEVDQWKYAREFLYFNTTDAKVILQYARLTILVLGTLFGFYLFAFVRGQWGNLTAVCAVGFYAFSPNLIAHSRLATQDFLLAVWVFLAIVAFWRISTQPTLRNTLLIGLWIGLAAATKTSTVFLAVALAGIALWRIYSDSSALRWTSLSFIKRLPTNLLQQTATVTGIAIIVSVIVLFVLNAVYYFEGTGHPLSAYVTASQLEQRIPHAAPLLIPILNLPLPLPEGLVELLRFQVGRVSGGNSLFFMGELSNSGWWYMMPVAFLIKTPVSLLIAVLVALVSWLRGNQSANCFETAAAITISVFIIGFSALSSVSIGIRYILPAYPFLCVLAGIGTARLLNTPGLLFPVTGGVLLAWQMTASLVIFPHYLAYFNLLIGGPQNGYKYLVDSYLDWGQDLPALRDYMDDRGLESINLGYFGSGDPATYGIDYKSMPSVGLAPAGGGADWWYASSPDNYPPIQYPLAVSATLLGGVFIPTYYKELRDHPPDAQVGYSILIFESPPESQ
ncbi:MAG: ArnT family glycosyltransferase [Pseudomonadales bacterium]